MILTMVTIIDTFYITDKYDYSFDWIYDEAWGCVGRRMEHEVYPEAFNLAINGGEYCPEGIKYTVLIYSETND